MTKPVFAGLRRRIADKILGKQTVLFTSRRNLDLMEAGAYLELPDEVLGAVTRRWFHAIEEVHQKAADREHRPVSTMIAQHAVLAIASYAAKAKATTASFTMRASIDGGKTEQVFRVDFKRLSDSYRFGPLGVEKVFDQDDPEKLTKLTLRFDTPGYAAWKAERARDSDASLAEDREDGLSGEAVAARAREGIAPQTPEPQPTPTPQGSRS